MFTGWRIFKYTRRITTEQDRFSHCGIRIDQHSESIFLDESVEDRICIYSGPSKMIEIALLEDNLEIKLVEWRSKETVLVILDKIKVDGRIVFDEKEKRVIFDKTKEIAFYKKEEFRLFYKALQSSKQISVSWKDVFVRDMAKVTSKGVDPKTFLAEMERTGRLQ